MSTNPRRERDRRGDSARIRAAGFALFGVFLAIRSFVVYAEQAPFNSPLIWESPPAKEPAALAPPADSIAQSGTQRSPAVEPPRLHSFPSPTERFRLAPAIDDIAREFGLDQALLHAVVWTESGYRVSALSPKGAVGLMQVMPATARRFGFENIGDPQTNLRAGATYLKWLLDRFDNRLDLALAAYNAGENAVERYRRAIPPFEETRRYVETVSDRYRMLQTTPPPHEALSLTALPERVPETPNRHRSPKDASPLLLLQKLGDLFVSAPPGAHRSSRN